MNRIEKLFEANKENLVIREEGVTPVQIIEKLVDIKELPLSTLFKIRIKILKENAAISFIERNLPFKEEDVKLHLYEIIRNEKSKTYYEELEKQKNSKQETFFEDETVYFILEDHIGLIESNSNIFWKDFMFAYGITEEDLQERNMAFMDYISFFDPERYNPPHIENTQKNSVVVNIDVQEEDELLD